MDFPPAIYFDTNIIRGLNVNAHPKFLELRELAQQIRQPTGIKLIIPQVVSLEWVHHHWETYIKKSRQTKSNLQEIEQLLGIKQPELIFVKDEFEQILETYKKKLETLGIIAVKTPKNIAIDELLFMAAFKVRPFEEKGEKGFRDAIILFTILEHMKTHKYKEAIFVSEDNIFQHEDVLAKIKEYSVNIQITHSYEETVSVIREILDDKRKQAIDLQNKKLMDFVRQNSERIFKFVKKNTEISEDFIEKESFLAKTSEIIGKVQEVKSFEPIFIQSAFVNFYRKKEESIEDGEPIMISVDTKLQVVYLPFNPFSKPIDRYPI